MKKKDFVLHLLAEISNFILEDNPSRMVVSLHQEDEGFHLCFIDSIQRDEKELKIIHDSIHGSSRPELSEYYGTMAGGDFIAGARLNLIGWQVKRGEVSQTVDGGTQIDIWLGSERFDDSQFYNRNKEHKRKK